MMKVRNINAPTENPDMLYAFIIDKIQRERELQESEREQLRIDVPREQDEKRPSADRPDQRERGVEIVDFNI